MSTLIIEMPYEARESLLKPVRNAVGDSEYRKLVAPHGEDGLLALLIAQAQARAEPSRGPAAAELGEEQLWSASNVMGGIMGLALGLLCALWSGILPKPDSLDHLEIVLAGCSGGIGSAVADLLRDEGAVESEHS